MQTVETPSMWGPRFGAWCEGGTPPPPHTHTHPHTHFCGRERGAGSGCRVQISNSGVSFQSHGLKTWSHFGCQNMQTVCKYGPNFEQSSFSFGAAFFSPFGYLAKVNRPVHTPRLPKFIENADDGPSYFRTRLCGLLWAHLGSWFWLGDTYRVWQVFLGAHQALDDLCPAAVAKVTGSHVVRRAVLQRVSAGHDLALDGGANKCPQHLHCHSWKHTE